MQISGLDGLEFKEEKNINGDLPNMSYDQKGILDRKTMQKFDAAKKSLQTLTEASNLASKRNQYRTIQK